MIYRVIENFLPFPYLSRLQNFVHSEHMNYYFMPETVIENPSDHPNRPIKRRKQTNTNCVETPQFTSVIYALHRNGEENKNSAYEQFSSIPVVLETHDIPVERIIRMKMNCLLPHVDTHENSYHTPHPDFLSYRSEFPHGDKSFENYILIFFPFDTDGFFHIFENRLENNGYEKELVLHKKLKPKENRACIIRSDQFHAGTNPIEYNARYSFNMVFTSYANVL